MKRRVQVFLSLWLLLTMLAGLGMNVYASNTTQGAFSSLGSLVVSGRETTSSAVPIVDVNKTYTTTGGGFVSYASLVSESATSTGFIVENNFSLLTSSSKREFLTDVFAVAEAADEASADITDDTLTAWSQGIQSCKGVDAQLIPVLMSGTKPDFISAMKIYAPFQSPMGTVMGVLALVLFSLLTFSTLIDLFFIGVPLFNMMVLGDGKEKPAIVSPAAYKAYLEELGNNGSVGGGTGSGKVAFKNAVGIYFKHRTVTLVLIFISLLYLVSGKIWDLVGDAMSLLGGL